MICQKMFNSINLIVTILLISNVKSNSVSSEIHSSGVETNNELSRYIIEGKIFPPDIPFTPPNWNVNTHITLNGGEYVGFVRDDGTFSIHNVPGGSYLVEVINADFAYEPVRVEINSKGKYRARKVNFIQTSQVIQVPYPLKMKPISKIKYFQMREEWRLTDFLFNPMVLMMVLPLVLIMILPKMMSDPETKKDLEQYSTLSQKLPEMPEMSELMTSWFPGSGGSGQQTNKKAVKGSSKKRQ